MSDLDATTTTQAGPDASSQDAGSDEPRRDRDPDADVAPEAEAAAASPGAPDDGRPIRDEDVAIRVRDLHISYRSVLDKRQTLRGRINRIGRHRDDPDTSMVKIVHAVRGVSFDVSRGEVLGIVGHNGAGKSTMLRGIAGILPPDEGRVEVAGQVSTLLALGVGFNNKLSGRENILVGGLAAGLSRREIDERADDIIDFSGVGDFIDMPLRTYSSGMRGRLAFAVSTAMDPDILLIDEALSAGDADFREKAADRMRTLLGEGRTIVLVSHSMNSVRDLSDRVLWLAAGRVVEVGEPDEVIERYQSADDAGRGRV